MQIEMEYAKQRESLSSQKSSQEVQASYDKLQAERQAAEERMMKLEERAKEYLHNIDELQRDIRTMDQEKHSNALRVSELEARIAYLEGQARASHAKEKGKSKMLMYLLNFIKIISYCMYFFLRNAEYNDVG